MNANFVIWRSFVDLIRAIDLQKTDYTIVLTMRFFKVTLVPWTNS